MEEIKHEKCGGNGEKKIWMGTPYGVPNQKTNLIKTRNI